MPGGATINPRSLPLGLAELERLAVAGPTLLPGWPAPEAASWVCYIPVGTRRAFVFLADARPVFDKLAQSLSGAPWFALPDAEIPPEE